MSRTIEPGDYALVTVNGQNYPMIISSVGERGIIAGNYPIIFRDGQWQVSGYQIPHSISFSPGPTSRPSFTGVTELDRLILLELDPPSLLRACSISARISAICHDDLFWRAKLERDYPDLLQYKPDGMTFRQQYISLYQIKDPYRAIREGRIDALMNLEREGVDLSKYTLVSLADEAARVGRLDILEWLTSRGIQPTYEAGRSAALGGNVDVLNWLDRRNFRFGSNELAAATAGGNPQAINWLLDRGINPSSATIVTAASTGNLGSLDIFFNRGIIPTKEAFGEAVLAGHFPVLQWASEKRIPIPKEAADAAFESKRFNILDWLLQRGVTPHPGILGNVVNDTDLSRLQWITTRGLLDQWMVDNLKGPNNRAKLRWLASQGIYPRKGI